MSLLTLAKTAMQMHVHPPTTTLVSMGADMIGDEGAADMPPDDEFTLEPLRRDGRVDVG